MKKIETAAELNDILSLEKDFDVECILRIFDNKSNVLLQTIVVKHPIMFIRGLQDFCKSVNLPVSDTSIVLIGFISKNDGLKQIDEVFEISPYVYFKKPEEVEASKED